MLRGAGKNSSIEGLLKNEREIFQLISATTKVLSAEVEPFVSFTVGNVQLTPSARV